MSANISAIEEMTGAAIKHFWRSRTQAADNQKGRGVTDQGNRASVTSGKNMDGFVSMVRKLIEDNGIRSHSVFTEGRNALTIPGFYRPTKNWDLLVVAKKQLIAAIEFKSQVGPSFGNNFNNRVEEALGNAVDLTTAFRDEVFEESQKPFIGYVFVLEDCEKSTRPVKFDSPHFSTIPEFNNTSYAHRYEIFCRKLVQEGLYDAAALLLSKSDAVDTGESTSLSEMTSAKRFAAVLAGKVTSIVAEMSS
jgi:type II restriction enzyme